MGELVIGECSYEIRVEKRTCDPCGEDRICANLIVSGGMEEGESMYVCCDCLMRAVWAIVNATEKANKMYRKSIKRTKPK